MSADELAAQAAIAHIVDACAYLTREQCMLVETALKAGWMSPDERRAIADLAAAFARLSVAGAPA